MHNCMVVMHDCLFMMCMQCNSKVKLVGGRRDFDSLVTNIRELYRGNILDYHYCQGKSMLAKDYHLTLLGERGVHDWFKQK